MTLPLVRYPLDPTGVSEDNLVVGELHVLPDRQRRAFATDYGGFYTESLVVRDNATQAILTPHVQYFAAELYEVPTAKYGKEVCAIIVITDTSVGDTVSVEYQAVGGDFSTSGTAIIQLLENLDIDNRPIAWGSIIGKPDQYPPSHHLHDVGDVFGFEYMVHALERIRTAIEMGDAVSHNLIYAYVDQSIAVVNSSIADVVESIDNHLTDDGDPHPQYNATIFMANTLRAFCDTNRILLERDFI